MALQHLYRVGGRGLTESQNCKRNLAGLGYCLISIMYILCSFGPFQLQQLGGFFSVV